MRGLAYSRDKSYSHAIPNRSRRSLANDKHMGERMLVGGATVEAYWEVVRAWHPPPRLVRERQFLMAVDRARLQPYDHMSPCGTRGRTNGRP